MKRKIAALTVAGVIGVAGLGTAGAASALTSTSSTKDDSLVNRLVEKFNLNKSDVEAVFTAEKDARDAERQADMSKRLQKAVDDKKITAAQKTLIENKIKELDTARKTEQTALEKWASDNKIDAKYLMGRGHGGGDDDRLQEAVNAGELTAAQKKLIEDKQSELEDARDKRQDELKQWAKDNNIDTTYLMMGGMGHGHGPKM